MENARIAKSVYMGMRVGSRLVGQPRNKWIDFANACLKRKRSEWWASMEDGV